MVKYPLMNEFIYLNDTGGRIQKKVVPLRPIKEPLNREFKVHVFKQYTIILKNLMSSEWSRP